MNLLRQSVAMAAKDLRIELRGRYALGAILPAIADYARAWMRHARPACA